MATVKLKQPKKPVKIGKELIDPKDVTVTLLPNGKYKATKAGKPADILAHVKSGQKKKAIDDALAAVETTTEDGRAMLARRGLKVR